MKRRLFLLATLTLTLPALAADKAEIEARAKSYHSNGKVLVEMAITKKVDAAEAQKRVDALVADAVWFANAYAAKHPKGAKLLKLVTDNVEAMKKASFKELEHDWHDLHFFDKRQAEIGINLKDEDNEHFTDPIHTLVHPLLVLKAAQAQVAAPNEENIKNIKEEMEEGLEQMEKLKGALLK